MAWVLQTGLTIDSPDEKADERTALARAGYLDRLLRTGSQHPARNNLTGLVGCFPELPLVSYVCMSKLAIRLGLGQAQWARYAQAR